MKAPSKPTKAAGRAPKKTPAPKRAARVAAPAGAPVRAVRKTKPKVPTRLTPDAAVLKLKNLIMGSLDDDKAEDIVALDLGGKSSLADWMIVATGRSSRQVSAISEHLMERLRTETGRTYRSEGKRSGEWVVIDAGDVIVHIFQPEIRTFYNLEKMWSLDIPDQEAV